MSTRAPFRAAVGRLMWLDNQGEMVKCDSPANEKTNVLLMHLGVALIKRNVQW